MYYIAPNAGFAWDVLYEKILLCEPWIPLVVCWMIDVNNTKVPWESYGGATGCLK